MQYISLFFQFWLLYYYVLIILDMWVHRLGYSLVSQTQLRLFPNTTVWLTRLGHIPHGTQWQNYCDSHSIVVNCHRVFYRTVSWRWGNLEHGDTPCRTPSTQALHAFSCIMSTRSHTHYLKPCSHLTSNPYQIWIIRIHTTNHFWANLDSIQIGQSTTGGGWNPGLIRIEVKWCKRWYKSQKTINKETNVCQAAILNMCSHMIYVGNNNSINNANIRI